MIQASKIRLAVGCLGAAGFFWGCSAAQQQPPDGTAAGTGGSTGGSFAAAGGMLGSGGSVAGSGPSTGGAMGSGGSTTGGTGGGFGAGGGVTGGSSGMPPVTGGASGTTGGSAGTPPVAGTGAGAAAGMSGASGSGGSGMVGNCNFTVMSQTADKMGADGIPTVGVVDWSVDLTGLTTAKIVFGLDGATPLEAPVDVSKGPKYHTLLLGMKGSKTYNFHIEVSNGATSCMSQSYPITTGAIPSGVPRITRTAGMAAASQAKGFIIGSSGLAGGGGFGGGFGGGGGGTSYAFIIDADGDIVWFTTAPATCSRATMSYDGQYMWMLELNVDNSMKDGGEVTRVSMDGLTRNTKIPGLSNCHHDLTVLPNGHVACNSWIQQSGDQPSDLLESDAEGNITKVVTLDSHIYLGGQGLGGGGNTFHANSIHYHPTDDSFTISDRNPNLYVKVSHQGQVLWQIGGSCTNAPAPKCVPGDWKVNHGHDLRDDGTFIVFNNGQSGASNVFFYKITDTGTFGAMRTDTYSPGTTSNVLGDVQRLPNGNTLVAFSTASVLQEIDPMKNLVQTINGPGGYADWRPTLYGPPARQ